MNHYPTISSLDELPHVCVVIPVYKAESTIEAVLRSIPEFVKTIVTVNDFSPDNSVQLIENFPDKRVHVVSLEQNQGVGGAVLAGYQKAISLGAEIVVKMDSDGQMESKYLLPLIKPILFEEADYTKGNRFLHSRELIQMPALRRFGNLGLSFLTKVSSGYWEVFDPTNGFTAIHATIIPELKTSSISKRYFFESSMLLELGTLRAAIRDVHIPAVYHNEKSNLSEYHSLMTFPILLLKGFFHRIWRQYFIRDFGIASISLLASICLLGFGFLFGSYQWFNAYFSGQPTPTGTVMLAALPIILGVQLLLQTVMLDVQNQPRKAIHPRLAWLNRFKNATPSPLKKAANQ